VISDTSFCHCAERDSSLTLRNKLRNLGGAKRLHFSQESAFNRETAKTTDVSLSGMIRFVKMVIFFWSSTALFHT
jgi:hypothetical protein